MLIVAYLWNVNGMTTWCLEAVRALAEAGQEVALICSSTARLPENFDCRVVRYDLPPPPAGLWGKLRVELSRLAPRGSRLLLGLQAKLREEQIEPRAYLLNSSDYFEPAIATPQYVVGWAYPPTLLGYARKIPTYGGLRLSREGLRTAMSTIGWYGRDWHAYKRSARVLSVSKRLNDALTRRGVRSCVVHPGTHVLDRELAIQTRTTPSLLIAAADLDDPRKRVGWMLSALARQPRRDFHLTLVGQASSALRELAKGVACTFTGMLPREQLQDLMTEQDLFCFGSCLDDWGYVLVEAMAAGLTVVAPRLSPFDEIVGDARRLYDPVSESAFTAAVFGVLDGPIAQSRSQALDRAKSLFSRQAFAQSLLRATEGGCD